MSNQTHHQKLGLQPDKKDKGLAHNYLQKRMFKHSQKNPVIP